MKQRSVTVGHHQNHALFVDFDINNWLAPNTHISVSKIAHEDQPRSNKKMKLLPNGKEGKLECEWNKDKNNKKCPNLIFKELFELISKHLNSSEKLSKYVPKSQHFYALQMFDLDRHNLELFINSLNIRELKLNAFKKIIQSKGQHLTPRDIKNLRKLSHQAHFNHKQRANHSGTSSKQHQPNRINQKQKSIPQNQQNHFLKEIKKMRHKLKLIQHRYFDQIKLQQPESYIQTNKENNQIHDQFGLIISTLTRMKEISSTKEKQHSNQPSKQHHSSKQKKEDAFYNNNLEQRSNSAQKYKDEEYKNELNFIKSHYQQKSKQLEEIKKKIFDIGIILYKNIQIFKTQIVQKGERQKLIEIQKGSYEYFEVNYKISLEKINWIIDKYPSENINYQEQRMQTLNNFEQICLLRQYKANSEREKELRNKQLVEKMLELEIKMSQSLKEQLKTQESLKEQQESYEQLKKQSNQLNQHIAQLVNIIDEKDQVISKIKIDIQEKTNDCYQIEKLNQQINQNSAGLQQFLHDLQTKNYNLLEAVRESQELTHEKEKELRKNVKETQQLKQSMLNQQMKANLLVSINKQLENKIDSLMEQNKVLVKKMKRSGLQFEGRDDEDNEFHQRLRQIETENQNLLLVKTQYEKSLIQSENKIFYLENLLEQISTKNQQKAVQLQNTSSTDHINNFQPNNHHFPAFNQDYYGAPIPQSNTLIKQSSRSLESNSNSQLSSVQDIIDLEKQHFLKEIQKMSLNIISEIQRQNQKQNQDTKNHSEQKNKLPEQSNVEKELEAINAYEKDIYILNQQMQKMKQIYGNLQQNHEKKLNEKDRRIQNLSNKISELQEECLKYFQYKTGLIEHENALQEMLHDNLHLEQKNQWHYEGSNLRESRQSSYNYNINLIDSEQSQTPKSSEEIHQLQKDEDPSKSEQLVSNIAQEDEESLIDNLNDLDEKSLKIVKARTANEELFNNQNIDSNINYNEKETLNFKDNYSNIAVIDSEEKSFAIISNHQNQEIYQNQENQLVNTVQIRKSHIIQPDKQSKSPNQNQSEEIQQINKKETKGRKLCAQNNIWIQAAKNKSHQFLEPNNMNSNCNEIVQNRRKRSCS